MRRTTVLLLLLILALVAISFVAASSEEGRPTAAARRAAAANKKLAKAVRKVIKVIRPANDPAQYDKVEVAHAYAKKVKLKSLGAINKSKKALESARKIAKLNRKDVAYYPAQQVFSDQEVDDTARGVIDTPERVAYRQKLKDDAQFLKTVSSAHSIFRAHQKLTAKRNPKKKLKSKAKKL